MDARRLTLGYVVTYLAVGGLGFLLVPEITFGIFQSNGDYSTEGFRVAGGFMTALAVLVGAIVLNADWKYYPVSIVVRIGFVVLLTLLAAATGDPMFLIIDVIVLIGLVPSILVVFRERSAGDRARPT